MYEKLLAVLRHCGNENVPCKGCPVHDECGNFDIGAARNMREAADAIEELIGSVGCYEATTDMALIEEDGSTVIRFMPKWIPVTEKPPKAYEEVLLLFPHNQAAGFCDRDGCWSVYSGDGFYTEVADNEPKPTHWARKLPEPPKEET